MYIHKVTITRPDTSAPFFYTDLLSNPVYLEFKKSYLDSGKLLNETVMQSPNNLIMIRVLAFASKEDFDYMMTNWAANNKFYVNNFLKYIEDHNHTVTFETSTTPVSYLEYSLAGYKAI
jgi:hypothetical protein